MKHLLAAAQPDLAGGRYAAPAWVIVAAAVIVAALAAAAIIVRFRAPRRSDEKDKR